jgi:hypothetical protein
MPRARTDATIGGMRDPGHLRVALAIEATADSVSGTVCSAESGEQAFTGWMELFSVLETAIRAAREDSGTDPNTEEHA